MRDDASMFTNKIRRKKRRKRSVFCMRSRLSFALYSLATIGAIRRNPFIRAYSSWFAPKNPGFFRGVFTLRKELAVLTKSQLPHATPECDRQGNFSAVGQAPNEVRANTVTGLKVLLGVMLGDSHTLQLLSISQVENKTR